MRVLFMLLLVCSNLLLAADVKQIPLNDLFSHAKVNGMKLSPNGNNVAFSYEHETERRLAIMSLKDMSVLSSFQFGENKHVIDFHWATDKRVLMEVTEVTGNLDSMSGSGVDLYGANIDGKRRLLLFKTQTAAYTILHLLPDQPDRILIGKRHYAERNGLRAFTLDINRGTERYLDDQPQGVIVGLLADNSGDIRIGIEFIEGKTSDENQLIAHYKKEDKWQRLQLPAQRSQPIVRPLGFSADNSKAYFMSNMDMATNDRLGLFVYDFNSGELNLMARHPYSDIDGGFYSHDGELLAISYVAGTLEYDFVNPEHPDAQLLSGLKNAFSGQRVNISSFDRTGSKALFSVTSDRNPGEFYLYDNVKKQARYLASAMPGVSSADLVPMQEISFVTRDGITLYGYLTLPAGAKENLPLIINVHGGPYGPYDSWGFNREAQLFANRGYAMLQVNFRGSGGYGDDFQRLGRLQWGKAMQDDLTDATLWAIEQGIADKERICIYGGSYGGYAALWGVIKEPDLYKCSVGYVGVYDMPIFFNGDGSDASRNPTIKDYLKTHVGEGQEYLQAISPVHNVDKIKAELFIVHGSKDVRVPIVHANNLRKALDKIGKPYEWLEKADGHGFYQVENRIALYDKMLTFFDKHIGVTSNKDVE